MFAAVVTFTLLAVVVVVAGTVLAHCADAIAEATGLGRLLIGSVLLAGTTSLPELVVDIAAIRMDLPDLAVGDLLGSSMMNLMILAVLDMTRYSRGRMLSRKASAHSLSAVFGIGMTALIGVAIVTTREFESWSFLGIHAWLWLAAVAYMLGVRLVYLDQKISAVAATEQVAATEPNHSSQPIWKAAVGFVIAAAVIVVAGPYLAESAGKIAVLSGLGKSFVGTTLVALSTSLPELAASYAAIRMGAHDLAIGNVFGSNAFNMLLFAPLDVFCPGALLAITSPVHVVSALVVIAAMCVVMISQLYHVERRTPFLEPNAMMLVFLIVAGLGVVFVAG
jgi:cation:H+ antiporter